MLTRYDFGNPVCCQKVRITVRAKGAGKAKKVLDCFGRASR
jgi:hypothetical protein